MREIIHPHGGEARRKQDAGAGEHQDQGKIPAQGLPRKLEPGFKNQGREKHGEQEFFGEAEPR